MTSIPAAMSASDRPPGTARRRLLGLRFALFAAVWLVLSEGSVRYWWFAALIVFAAAWASTRLVPRPLGIRPGAAVTFLRFFLEYSLRGGIDVAVRALRFTPDLHPGIVEFEIRLPPGSARTFYTLVIGLLPGTLCTATDGDRMYVHLLDVNASAGPQLRALEVHVAATFGLTVEN